MKIGFSQYANEEAGKKEPTHQPNIHDLFYNIKIKQHFFSVALSACCFGYIQEL